PDSGAVRRETAPAVGAHETEQPLLALDPLGPGLGEAGGDDAERLRARRERRLGGVEDVLAREADHREVDLVRDLADRRVRSDAGNRLAGAVDRVRGAGEVAAQDVAKELAADRPAPRRRTEDGDGMRLEERPERGGDGDVVAQVDTLAVGLGRRDR